MKAVIYARYSSDNQREESIEGQIRECTAFAEKNGITILRHYIDRAFSAKTDNRPEFQNMIKDSGKRLFDMIIVWKLDRFARNRYDSARYKAALKKNGVKVVSATEVISDGAEGIILESVLEGYAEYYSADLSEKVVRGMTENALKSKYNGGTRPIGYLIDRDQHFQLDPLTAPFVREAFQRYDEGATMTAIRDWLNEQGVKNTRGQKMTYNSVQHLLNNRRYIGEYTYRDIVVPDGIPAIVPQDLFDRVQQKLSKNKKAPARHKAEDDYLLTTKLFCGYCGAYLCGESGTSHTGNVHHYYKCVSVKKKRTECHKKSVRKEWIEDLVVSETMKMVMDDEAIEAIVSMLMDLQDRENVNLPLYEQQLREADTAIQNLLNAIQQGILTKSTKSRLEELEATKEELETKIACEKLAKPKVSAEFMTFWLQRFRKLDVRQKSHRKMLIDTFINAIFLYDDKMVITFNYKEGTTTITFDDLKTALADQKTGSDLDCSTAPQKSTQQGRIVRAVCFLFCLCAESDYFLTAFGFRRMEKRGLFPDGGHQQHHRPPHFVFHALQMQHFRRGLGLHNMLQLKAVDQQGVQVGGQGPVVLDDLFPQKHRLPAAFIVIVVHRKMKDLSVLVVVPVLGAIGGEHRVFHRKDKMAAGPDPLGNPGRQGPKILYIMEGQGAQNHIEAPVGKVQVLHGDALVLDLRGGVDFPGLLKHFLGDVRPQHRGGLMVGGVLAMPAVTAPQVQNPLPRKSGKHLLQLGPFAGPLQALLGPQHLAVFLEKDVVVVFVFFHVRVLPCKYRKCFCDDLHGFMQFFGR